MAKKTVSEERRKIACDFCQEMGLEVTIAAKCVDAVANMYELDLQNAARNIGLRYLSLDETYALICIFQN